MPGMITIRKTRTNERTSDSGLSCFDNCLERIRIMDSLANSDGWMVYPHNVSSQAFTPVARLSHDHADNEGCDQEKKALAHRIGIFNNMIQKGSVRC